MERGPNSKNKVTKTREFSWKTTKKLGSNEEINRNSKRSHEKTVQQKEIESTRIEERRQHVAEG